MRAYFFFAPLLLCLSACLFLPPLEEPFECEGTCVGDLDLSIPNGRVYGGPLPAPTSTGNEPVISSAKWVKVDENYFALEFETSSSVNEVLIEINGTVYAIYPEIVGGSADSLNACNMLASQQGYSCTAACLEACSCVTCDDPEVEKNMVNSCAVNCSIYDNQGMIGPEPYTSEAVFADLVYNGMEGVQGMVAQVPGCSANVCSTRANAEKAAERRRLSFYRQNFDFLANLQVGNLVATADPVDDTPIVSNSISAPATLGKTQGCLDYALGY